MRRRRIALAVAACAVWTGQATADAIRVHYRIDRAGVEIGTLRIEIDADRYRVVLDGSFGAPDTSAALRMTAQAAGQLLSGRIQPDLYTASLIRAGITRRVAVAFANGAVGAVAVLPPVAGGSASTQPLGSQGRGVVDPLSALAFPAAPRGLAPLSTCGRIQRVFDGLARYDVELFPSRVESIVLADKPVETMVCRAQQRAVPAAGMRRWPDASPANKGSLWLAPLAEGRFLLPVRIEANLGWGRVLLETTDPRPFQAATRAAALDRMTEDGPLRTD
jgi:hypothetical protein